MTQSETAALKRWMLDLYADSLDRMARRAHAASAFTPEDTWLVAADCESEAAYLRTLAAELIVYDDRPSDLDR